MKLALAIIMSAVLTACTVPDSPPQAPPLAATADDITPTPTLDLCTDIDQWAADVSQYDDSVGDKCGGNPNVTLDEATECKQTAVAAWDSLTEISPPLITSSTHDLLRRAMIYQLQAVNEFLKEPGRSLFQIPYNKSVDMRRQFRERRDLMLALCGHDQSKILADIEWIHTVEDFNERIMLTDDPIELERLRQELRLLRDARIARPESERTHAIELIESIAGQDAVVDYLYTQGTLEGYAVGRTWFLIDRTTDTLIEINELQRNSPTDPARELDLTPLYTFEQLEGMAQEFIHAYAPHVDLEALTPAHHFDQGSQYYWFRWSLSDSKDDFIQTGYTGAGEIVAYTNAFLIH